MFKSTAKRARNSIVIIWIVSCIIMIPQAIVMECSTMLPGLANKTTLFTVCDERWGGKYIMAHKLTFILQMQTKNLICKAIIKLTLLFYWHLLVQFCKSMKTRSKPKTISLNSSACLVLWKYNAQFSGFHIFQIGTKGKAFSRIQNWLWQLFLSSPKQKGLLSTIQICILE